METAGQGGEARAAGLVRRAAAGMAVRSPSARQDVEELSYSDTKTLDAADAGGHVSPRAPTHGGDSSQALLFPLGGRRWPQLPRPVGKRAAVRRQDTAVRVVGEEPAEAGFESPREQRALGFRVLLLRQLLCPPVANVNSPIQNFEHLMAVFQQRLQAATFPLQSLQGLPVQLAGYFSQG